MSNAWIERLEEIKSCITTFDATQSTLVSKVASLEKVVMSVQEDMASVRGDVRVMREVLENLVEAVGMLHSTVADVEGVPNHRSPNFFCMGLVVGCGHYGAAWDVRGNGGCGRRQS